MVSDILKRKSEYLSISSPEQNRKRNNLQLYIKSDEAANASDINKLNEYQATIAEKLSEYCVETDDEIVETVRPNSSADDLQDEEEIIPIIFLTEVLINVENLINLHNFPLENFK
ncbi:hypothetical protein RhiirA5_386294 [Rhizophagus irregularis]|uniref:Uncharacterized protein n=1 Tax=Rhizophagus irregularis TaxID=588596 RepID=A0A2N0NKB3_9GLOM|nr:hypothetical protein RhiirA5_386294 [Rhizophagus irregularis]